LFRLASSFKFINVDGMIHYVAKPISEDKLSIEERNQMFHEELINVMSIFNLTKNTSHVNYAEFELKNAWKYYFLGLNEENKKLALNIYKDIVDNSKNTSNNKELGIIIQKTLKKDSEMSRYYRSIFE
jgi:hypothetical protein